MEEDESGEEEEVTVSVRGRKVPYHEVTAELAATMTAQEREAYMLLGRQLYDDYE